MRVAHLSLGPNTLFCNHHTRKKTNFFFRETNYIKSNHQHPDEDLNHTVQILLNFSWEGCFVGGSITPRVLVRKLPVLHLPMAAAPSNRFDRRRPHWPPPQNSTVFPLSDFCSSSYPSSSTHDGCFWTAFSNYLSLSLLFVSSIDFSPFPPSFSIGWARAECWSFEALETNSLVIIATPIRFLRSFWCFFSFSLIVCNAVPVVSALIVWFSIWNFWSLAR